MVRKTRLGHAKAFEMTNADEKSKGTETVNAKGTVNGTATGTVMNEQATKKGETLNAREMTGTARIGSVEVMTRNVNIANEWRENTKNSNATSSHCSTRSKSSPRLANGTRSSDSNVSYRKRCRHFKVATLLNTAETKKNNREWNTFITQLSFFAKPPGIFTKPESMKMLTKSLSSPKRSLAMPDRSLRNDGTKKMKADTKTGSTVTGSTKNVVPASVMRWNAWSNPTRTASIDSKSS
jgi:hypothetical protein